MNGTLRFAFHGALCLILAIASPAIASIDPTSGARLDTYPNPPPANEVFDASLVILAHPEAFGIGAREGPPSPAIYRITETTIDLLFDKGCGLYCGPGEPRAIRYQFQFPALPPGLYTARVVDGFGPSSLVLASFPINVGAGVGAPTTLPIGGEAVAALLIALLVATAARQLRAGRRTA